MTKKKDINFLFLIILILIVILCQHLNIEIKKELLPKIEGCSWCLSAKPDEPDFLPYKTEYYKLFAPADNEMTADILWLRTCYYFGYHGLTDKQYPHLFFLIDKIGDLSKKWSYPYVFGTIALLVEAENPFEAMVLCDKGIEKFPDIWILRFYKGYILWKSFEDYEGASENIFKASLLPEAPKYLSNLAATFAKKSGHEMFFEKFIETALESIEDKTQKEIFINKLRKMEESE
ncbi:MAG: tetratricopeptide repeat protein [Desulfobacteraceae bacterium]